MNLSSIHTTLPSVISTIVGGGVSVYWREQPQAWREERHVALDVVGVASIGRDEYRQKDEGGKIRQRAYGVRRLDIQVTCEAQAQTLDVSALDLAEAIRAGLWREDIRDLLASAEVGISTVMPARMVPYTDSHGRRRSAAVFDVRLNTSTTALGILVDWIESVTYDATIKDETGSAAVSDTVTIK